MKARNGKAKFKNFIIISDIRCNFNIGMKSLIEKLNFQKYAGMQRHIQEGDITTCLKDRIYFTLPELSSITIVMWNFHVHDSAKGKYCLILGRYLLT